MVKLSINGQEVKVPEGTTVLAAAKQIGIEIPTLCAFPEINHAPGACRVCVVEVEGARTLVASCVAPVAEGMKVNTNTARVREARRTVVELLLSEHDGDCQTCDRNDDCELQALARELGIREVAYRRREELATRARQQHPGPGPRHRPSASCAGAASRSAARSRASARFPAEPRLRDRRSARPSAQNLDDVVCVQCGQCAAVCPVGAITEQDQIDEVWAALDDPNKHVVVQTAPAIRAALGECFGYPPGTLVTGKMVAALRRLGFDGVFDTNFTADLTIIEEGTELLTRLKKALVDKEHGGACPCSPAARPGWIKFIEHFYPDMLPNLSTCKSPQQMFGAVAKTYYAQKLGKKPEDIFVVSVMPCTAKKFEAPAAGDERQRRAATWTWC